MFPILITQKILLFVRPTDWLGAAFASYLFIYFPSNPNTQTHQTQWKGIGKTKKEKKEKERRKLNLETQCEKERKEGKEEEEEEEEEEEKNRGTKPKPSVKGKKKEKEKKMKKKTRPDLTTLWLWVSQICVYLPKCHYNSVSITQIHLKVVFSFHNSSFKNQRIKWWKQKLKTNPNSRGTHQFWVICDENRVIGDGKH